MVTPFGDSLGRRSWFVFIGGPLMIDSARCLTSFCLLLALSLASCSRPAPVCPTSAEASPCPCDRAEGKAPDLEPRGQGSTDPDRPLVLSTTESLTPLPAPQKAGGMPLMNALSERRSHREFSSEPLGAQALSELLWAAFGVNRPDSGKRTAPSARNFQEIDIYIAKADGLFIYRHEPHALEKVGSADIRALTGKQPFVEKAPVNLVYVADLERASWDWNEEIAWNAGADTGLVAQNAYLYCASKGLATVVRGWIDRDRLAKAMELGAHQKIILAQSVGYPTTR